MCPKCLGHDIQMEFPEKYHFLNHLGNSYFQLTSPLLSSTSISTTLSSLLPLSHMTSSDSFTKLVFYKGTWVGQSVKYLTLVSAQFIISGSGNRALYRAPYSMWSLLVPFPLLLPHCPPTRK